MLNNNKPQSNVDEDDSTGSEYVLLDAEEPEAEPEAETQTNETTRPDEEVSLLSEPSDGEDLRLVEEASDLLLERFVDEPEPENFVIDGPLANDSQTDEAAVDRDNAANEAVDTNEDAKPVKVVDKEAQDVADDATPTEGAKDPADGVEEEEAEPEEDNRSDDTKSEEGSDGTEEKEPDVERAEFSKESEDPESDKSSKDPASVTKDSFKFGTRGEVNGAAAVFGVAALIVAGPLAGVAAAILSAHIAANKPCKCATFTRQCGGVVNNIGKKKRLEMAAKNAKIGVVSKPNIFDKITDRLVEGGEWTEKKIIPHRRRA